MCIQITQYKTCKNMFSSQDTIDMSLQDRLAIIFRPLLIGIFDYKDFEIFIALFFLTIYFEICYFLRKYSSLLY